MRFSTAQDSVSINTYLSINLSIDLKTISTIKILFKQNTEDTINSVNSKFQNYPNFKNGKSVNY